MMTHTEVHYHQLQESHSSSPNSPPKQCICSILTTIAVTNHEYGQPCMQSELDQSDHAVLRLLPNIAQHCFPQHSIGATLTHISHKSAQLLKVVHPASAAALQQLGCVNKSGAGFLQKTA